MSAPTRPVLRWHGGKWKLAPWIISHFPPHRVYVEPFGGAASVLLRKPRAYAEVYNDLDDEVVNLFRVLRDAYQAVELTRQLELTPFARIEFRAARQSDDSPIERARRFVLISHMGFGSAGVLGTTTGFRADSKKSGTTPAHDWRSYPEIMPAVIDRLRGVVIECRPALKVLEKHDAPDALHYVDPPYVPDTRSQKRGPAGLYHSYRHELTDADHAELLDVLQGLAGMVILSGYPHPMYDDALTGWYRTEKQALADGARERTEVLWINPAAREAFLAAQAQPDIFEGAG